jgi:chemotaxis protein CheD
MDKHAAPLQIYLMPGEIYFSELPALISTLLGSCVAVTMYNPSSRSGAICHGLLPSCRGKKPCECDEFCHEGMRFVDCSIQRMLEWFKQKGVERKEIVVKVFGGSEMIGGGEPSSRASVGQQNISKAFQVLEMERLRIAASDVGGPRGRKIVFSTHTGEVMLKRLRKSESGAILLKATAWNYRTD